MQTRSKNNTTANSKLPNNYKLAQKEFGCWHVQNWQSWCISSPDFEKKSGFQTPVWCLSWLDYPLQTGKGSNVISTRRIHRFWTNQLAPTSPNLRVCFKKIAHRRILLAETFGSDLSQTDKAETFLKTVNSPSISGRKTLAIWIFENFRISEPDRVSGRALVWQLSSPGYPLQTGLGNNGTGTKGKSHRKSQTGFYPHLISAMILKRLMDSSVIKAVVSKEVCNWGVACSLLGGWQATPSITKFLSC